jgi:hypothetical protein
MHQISTVLQGGAVAAQEVLREEQKPKKETPKRGGSRKGHAPNLRRDFEGGYQRLYHDYFSESPVYTDYQFRRRFRMHKNLFLKIVEDVEKHNDYFVHKVDALGKPGLRGIQKITSSIRILAYGGAMDANDEYIRIGESTASKSLYRFCQAVIDLYSGEYLRAPNESDVKQLLAVGKDRGFPGMLGSLDCMHWQWKNCPTAWHGQYQGKEKVTNFDYTYSLHLVRVINFLNFILGSNYCP